MDYTLLGGAVDHAVRVIELLGRGLRPQFTDCFMAPANLSLIHIYQRDIAGMISRLARADLDFKTGAMPDRLLMEVLVSEICG